MPEPLWFDPQDVEDSWEHHGWLAARDNRTARTREDLARLIDTSAYEEALALPAE